MPVRDASDALGAALTIARRLWTNDLAVSYWIVVAAITSFTLGPRTRGIVSEHRAWLLWSWRWRNHSGLSGSVPGRAVDGPLGQGSGFMHGLGDGRRRDRLARAHPADRVVRVRGRRPHDTVIELRPAPHLGGVRLRALPAGRRPREHTPGIEVLLSISDTDDQSIPN